MAREPTIGGDNNSWGSVLNTFLSVSLNSDGTINPAAITSTGITGGLKYLTGGGTINAATITTAQASGFQGIFLDPRYVWDASGLVINGVQNFIIESRMVGSIGWLGHISYNTGGYIKTDTGNPTDGVQIYASNPGSAQTQGVIFKNCVLVGSHSRAVVHFGGGQRRCGLVDTLVYNTNSSTGAWGVVNGSALSDNNSEFNIFSFTGGGGIAGAYGAIGIGVADQTQRANDTWYYDLTTSGGTYSIEKTGGGNHTFVAYYDRSNPATATVWNHGGGRLLFIGGEDQNTTGLSHLVDNASSQTMLLNRTVTQSGTATTTMQCSAGSIILRGNSILNVAQTIALSGSGNIDLADSAVNAANGTISGSAGNLILANNYVGSGAAPILTSWTGNTVYQWPAVVVSSSNVAVSTTQTVTWTPPAAFCGIRVSVMIHPTTVGTSTVPVLAFTERGALARSATIPMWQANSAATAPSYTCAALDSFYGTVTSQTDNSASPVTVTITPTGSTFRFYVVIERVT